MSLKTQSTINIYNLSPTRIPFPEEPLWFIVNLRRKITIRLTNKPSYRGLIMQLDSFPIKISQSGKGAVAIHTSSGRIYVEYKDMIHVVEPVEGCELMPYYTSLYTFDKFYVSLYCPKTMKYFTQYNERFVEDISGPCKNEIDAIVVFDLVNKTDQNIKEYIRRLLVNDQTTDCIVVTVD